MPGMIKAESASPSEASISHSLLSLQSSSPPAATATATATATAPPPPPSSEERGLRLIHLLYLCANAVASNDLQHANLFMEQLSGLASLTGDPMQRVATYFLEGLAARVTKSWPGLYKALYSTRLSSDSDIAAARHILFSVSPYLKFGYLTANQAILDAMQGEKVVHVVDLEVGGGNSVLQWLALLQAFSSRPEGPPHLRITAVNEKREVLALMGQKLAESAERLDIPFQFHPVAVTPAALERDMLGVKSGEAVAVTSLMQLHSLLADEKEDGKVRGGDGGGTASFGLALRERSKSEPGFVSCKMEELKESKSGCKRSRDALGTGFNGIEMNGHDDSGLELGIGVFPVAPKEAKAGTSSTISRVLQLLHSLSPKIMVVVEQESNHNGALHERFAPALHYYSAIFDSLDSTLPQHSSERITVERLIFGQEIRNIVACEGLERMERHETLSSWKRRFEQAHFSSSHLSPTTAVQAERLLTIHSPDGYKLHREKGSLILCWQDTPMLSVSAWKA
ncbi:scarecrow-like protein 3 [Selaginella moellendorffii]|uniref:scarecrow-like protein 3 n=1 Tax=Selaginella moellendorffii TaxID=88036 RepID=UPI000D1C685D|nr:scarecrow-like protein 3 [Selaginella moellendorffii]|eukprot:XP_024522481.1 scarecrow-like protein 3 [Selaginella moellendorffii]